LRNYSGTPNLLSMMDSKQHATRRRIVSQIYSKSYILGSADFRRLAQILLFDRLLPNLDDAAKTGNGIDVFELGQAIGAEFGAAYMYGTGSGLDIMSKGKEQKRKAYVTAGKMKVLEAEGWKEAAKFLEDDNLAMCGKAGEFLTYAKEKKSKVDDESTSTYPVVYALLMESIPEKEGPKTPEETLYLTASELLDNMEAARTAIGGALCYILHELTLQPALQASLRDELMTLDPPLTHPPGSNRISAATLHKLDGLALLNAVILETLRVRNPILLPARRVVPPGGTVIDGFYIPAGTTVSMSSYVLHMNADVFPEPEKWIPQRWIGLPDRSAPEQGAGGDDQGEAEKWVDNDPRRWFWTFISGSKMCVGNNLAMMIMKLAVAGIYTNYTTYVIDDEGIEQLDRAVASPAGDKLILGFNRVPKA